MVAMRTFAVHIPESLLKRANALGFAVEEFDGAFVGWLEDELKRREAGRFLLDAAEVLQQLPDHEKPSELDIQDAIADFWRERQ